MNEYEDVVFDEVAQRIEREEQNRGTQMLDEVKNITSIKDLKKFLCTEPMPRGHKGMPRINKCKTCRAQCGYGKRLIELAKDIYEKPNKEQNKEPEKNTRMDEAPEKEVNKRAEEVPATEDESIRTVRITRSQAFNVAEFIEIHLIDAIRNDPDLDNVEWIADMLEARKAFKEAAK